MGLSSNACSFQVKGMELLGSIGMALLQFPILLVLSKYTTMATGATFVVILPSEALKLLWCANNFGTLAHPATPLLDQIQGKLWTDILYCASVEDECSV